MVERYLCKVEATGSRPVGSMPSKEVALILQEIVGFLQFFQNCGFVNFFSKKVVGLAKKFSGTLPIENQRMEGSFALLYLGSYFFPKFLAALKGSKKAGMHR